MSTIHVGDVGTVLQITLTRDGATFDLSTATVKTFTLISPTHVKQLKTAAFTNSGSDGKVQYTTIAGDLNEPGVWTMQAHVELSIGIWSSDVVPFTVAQNL